MRVNVVQVASNMIALVSFVLLFSGVSSFSDKAKVARENALRYNQVRESISMASRDCNAITGQASAQENLIHTFNSAFFPFAKIQTGDMNTALSDEQFKESSEHRFSGMSSPLIETSTALPDGRQLLIDNAPSFPNLYEQVASTRDSIDRINNVLEDLQLRYNAKNSVIFSPKQLVRPDELRAQQELERAYQRSMQNLAADCLSLIASTTFATDITSTLSQAQVDEQRSATFWKNFGLAARIVLVIGPVGYLFYVVKRSASAARERKRAAENLERLFRG